MLIRRAGRPSIFPDRPIRRKGALGAWKVFSLDFAPFRPKLDSGRLTGGTAFSCPLARHTNEDAMDDETKKKIFRQFFSTKGSAGTGLGLSVVNTIAKEHKGKIEVESNLGKGTLFRIMLMM